MSLLKENLVISNHAIEKYRLRTQTLAKDEALKEKILSRLSRARQVKHKNGVFAARALIDHNFEKTLYLRHGDCIFVLIEDGDKQIVKTVHKGEARRWINVTD